MRPMTRQRGHRGGCVPSRQRGRRDAALGWSLSVLLGGAACGKHAPPQVPARGGTLQVAVFEPLDSPSPLFGMRPLTQQLIEHVTPPLGRFDAQGRLQLELASRSVDTGGHIDYTLRPVRWEDGARVSPQDVVRTATLLLEPAVHSPDRHRMDLLRNCTVADDSTARFEYAILYGRRVRDSLLMPVPAHRLPPATDLATLRTSALSTHPLACGPFRVAASTTSEMLLVRNDSSGFPPARLDSVVVRQCEVEPALNDYLRGNLDALVDLPVGRVQEARRRRGSRVVALVGASYTYIAWNLRDGRFADPVVRRAAAQGVDVARLMRAASLGQGDIARGPLTALCGFADTTAVLGYDPPAAARALEAAGWSDADGDGVRDRRGAHLDFDILAPQDDPLRLEIARAVGRDLRHIGMAAEVRPMPIEALVSRLNAHRFEAFVGLWYPDPGLDLEPVWRSDATDQFNYIGYASRAADSLMVQMQHELPDEARGRLLSAFQARVYADQPYLFLFQNPHFLVLAPAIQGAEPNVISPFWNLPEWWRSAPARPTSG